MNDEKVNHIRKECLRYFKQAGIALTPEEKENMEVTDFGMGRLREMGLQLVVYINTESYCAKEMVLLPRQTCPEHLHPPIGTSKGKEETFRCRMGRVYLYVSGTETPNPSILPPQDKMNHFTVWKEVLLKPGEQYTISPNTLHWFQAGETGAVVSEFSTQSTDENDVFTDPAVQRV
ncbi:D-lyxose/D-mannose family sugar isomerase [Salibacterium aidingense]|uniref:D-lyxose/D-mannose family sugar isomerase n=1 Tax=Salibacterium aidingense TaxID=384933 RepID=UPI0004008DD5|nr:D-lyxose/D-mannose family sugar isomerase [Salibacterium aidingense]